MATLTTAAKKSRFVKVSELKDLVEFFKANGVKKFKHGDLEIEIDTFIRDTLQDGPATAKDIKSLFSQEEDDPDRDLFWSTDARGLK